MQAKGYNNAERAAAKRRIISVRPKRSVFFFVANDNYCFYIEGVLVKTVRKAERTLLFLF